MVVGELERPANDGADTRQTALERVERERDQRPTEASKAPPLTSAQASGTIPRL